MWYNLLIVSKKMPGCQMDKQQNGLSNYLLEKVYLDQLQKDIKEKASPELTGMNRSAWTIEEVSIGMDQACLNMQEIFDEVNMGGKLSIERIKNEIIPIIQIASSSARIFELLHQNKRKEDYTYWHSICVGVLSTIIGNWMRLSPEKCEELMIASVLHDVGKAMIPKVIVNKTGKLTSNEYNMIKQHTVFGYDLLHGLDHIPESAAIVSLQHHEREDGMGYPYGLKGDQIHYFAKIVAIADIYHAMSSERVYHDATPFYLIIKQMQNDVYGKLDAHILLVFMERLLQALVGKKIQMNNGEFGYILLMNRYNPLKSLVKTERGIIDLMAFPELEITKIINEV